MMQPLTFKSKMAADAVLEKDNRFSKTA